MFLSRGWAISGDLVSVLPGADQKRHVLGVTRQAEGQDGVGRRQVQSWQTPSSELQRLGWLSRGLGVPSWHRGSVGPCLAVRQGFSREGLPG